MNALGLRSIFIAASVQPITVHSLILPSNIKIQRSGSEFLDDSHVIRPAADMSVKLTAHAKVGFNNLSIYS